MKDDSGLPEVFFENVGRCAICSAERRFVARDPWLRDHYLCAGCGSCPRQRALVEILNWIRPKWRKLRIHESSPTLPYFAKECVQYTASFFFEELPLGVHRGGYDNQNLECLTFDAEHFDVFITQDVLEHVFRPELAIREIMRVLRTGGIHIFTAPKHKHILKSYARSVLKDGIVEHQFEPVYHGSPVGDGRALVTWDYGADFDDLLQSWSGYNTSAFVIRDRSHGIDGEYLDVFVTQKLDANRLSQGPRE